MGQRIGGICYVKVDGQQIDVTGSWEAPLLDTKRETKMGTNGPAGYSEVAQEPYIKGTVYFRADFPLAKLQSSTDMTVTAEWPNGKVYTLSGAYLRGDTVVKSDEGTVELDFGGDRGEWQ